MFKEFFLFEFRFWFRRPLIYIYFLVFFVLSFALMSAMAGLFDIFTSTTDHGRAIINSAFNIQQYSQGVIRYAYFLIPSLLGAVVYRDFQYNMHSIIYTTPITKFGYLVGRFSSAFLITLMVFVVMELGVIAACHMPWVSSDFVGPFRISVYLQHIFYINLPNLILFGAMVFGATVLSRRIVFGYIIVVLLYLCQGLLQFLLADIDNVFIGALFDPYGSTAVSEAAKYWTVAEQNQNLLPFSGVLLYNRLLWTGFGILLFILAYWRFQFSHFARTATLKKKVEQLVITGKENYRRLALPTVNQISGFRHDIVLMFKLAYKEFLIIVKSIAFMIVSVITIGVLIIASSEIGTMYGTNTFPVTREMVGMAGSVFGFFLLLLTFLYSGYLLTRERRSEMDQLIDTTPVRNWVMYLSKFFGVVLMQLLFVLLIIISCMVIQGTKGYFNFEFHLYIKELFGIQLIDLIIYTLVAFFVQALLRNFYVGFGILILYLILSSMLGSIGVEQMIYKFNSAPSPVYSDMNGYGYSIIPFLIYKLYWGGLAVFLALIGNLFRIRGVDQGIMLRISQAKGRMTAGIKMSLIASLLVFIGMGWFIYYQTNIKNEFKDSLETEMATVDYEKTYVKYRDLPQPRIIDVKVDIDIFPEEKELLLKGKYVLKNKTKVPIDKLFVNYTNNGIKKTYTLNIGNETEIEDTVYGVNLYRLLKPLQPGQSFELSFEEYYAPNGPLDGKSPVLHNGTFLNSFVMATIGYNENAELEGVAARKKYDLPPKERMPSVYDTLAVRNNYISDCSDWINFETTMSTSGDQIAIAPGYLIKEWQENGRNYYKYKMDSKILGFFSVISARYEVKKDVWKSPEPDNDDVNIEIFYHKGHEYNLDKMIESIKISLDYYTANFSPYQHKQVRIIEFPINHGMFAQSFPNTIPYSEGLGFIADLDTDDPEAVDYMLFVTSHEIAHQWWAHQVIGGAVQGATLMSEALSQYSAMMVMEKSFGKEKMRRFLKHELDGYLKGRKREKRQELPMYLIENQQYIHYNKGAVVMYALRDYIGEDSLNLALRRYIKDVAFQEPPYTNSLEFLTYIKAVTPDSLQYVITDMFETITLYSNKVDSASYHQLDNGKYEVDMYLSCGKYNPDAEGGLNEEFEAESEGGIGLQVVLDGMREEKLDTLELADWIDVGVFAENDGTKKELYLAKHKFSKEKSKISVIVDEEPVEVGIDPYNKLIDRKSDDNRKEL